MSEGRQESAEERREQQTPAGGDPSQTADNQNTCPECGGSGKIQEDLNCPNCGGTGKVAAVGQG